MNVTPLWSVLIRQNIGFAYSITNMVRFCGPQVELLMRRIFTAAKTEEGTVVPRIEHGYLLSSFMFKVLPVPNMRRNLKD
jgi:hypothetical protein